MISYRIHNVRQREEDPLNLRSLPLVDPPIDAWPEIEAALLRRNGKQRGARYAGGALAAAATLTLAVGLYFGGTQRQPAAEPSALTQAESPASTVAEEPDTSGQLESLIGLSQQLESRLRLLRAQAGDMPAGALVYQVELEDLVVQVDDALSMNPDSLPLWNQRVSLLADLNTLYEDKLRREYQQIASL